MIGGWLVEFALALGRAWRKEPLGSKIGIGLAVWQLRRDLPAASDAAEVKTPHNALGAWQGWREFRVARRDFEDSGLAQCSFYLEPLDGLPLLPFQAGQFLAFELPIADRKVVRCYSLSDRPDPPVNR